MAVTVKSLLDSSDLSRFGGLDFTYLDYTPLPLLNQGLIDRIRYPSQAQRVGFAEVQFLGGGHGLSNTK